MGICLELEDQIKEYERLIEKLESSQERLATANSELKGKTEKSSSDYISARSEKNEQSRNFYEAEGQHWKSRYEEIATAFKESSQNAAEFKEALTQTTQERNDANQMNDQLNEQNY